MTAPAPLLWTGDARRTGERLITTGLLGSIRWWLEVITPPSRTPRAGAQPIFCEVVAPGAEAALHRLYPPALGAAARDGAKAADALARLVEAIAALRVSFGISAKRTVGWLRKAGKANAKVLRHPGSETLRRCQSAGSAS